MRIAIVINTSWNIFNFRMGLIKALQKEGHEVVAIAPKDDYSKQLEEAGCVYEELPMDNKGANPLNDLRLFFRFWRIYRRVQPDVVLQYTVKPNVYGTFAAKVVGIPSLNNVSGLGTLFIRRNLVSKVGLALYKWAFRYPETVFFQNNDDKELFVRTKLVRRELTGLLPGSGVDLDRFQPVKSEENNIFTFLLVARLLQDKGVREYAEAAKQLKNKGLEVRFQLCGFFDEAAGLGISKDEVQAWVDEGSVEYLGGTDNVENVMAGVDVVVLPSYREGTPKTLLEAAAMAKPLVTTNVPGCREVVVEGVNGFLCRAKDANHLADRMLEILSLPKDELQAMGRESRQLAEEKFDQKLVIKKYLEKITNVGVRA